MSAQRIAIPDIINPFAAESNVGDRAFVEDLNLEELVEKVRFYFQDSYMGTRALARSTLASFPQSTDTILYRQEFFAELLQNEELRNKLKNCFEKYFTFNESARHSIGDIKYTLLTNVLEVMKNYVGFVESTLFGANLQSRALASANAHFESIKVSDITKKIFEFERNLNSGLRLEFKVETDSQNRRACNVKRGNLKNAHLSDEVSFQSFTAEGSQDSLSFGIVHHLKQEGINLLHEGHQQISDSAKLLAQLDFYISFADYFAKLKKEGFDVCLPEILSSQERKMKVCDARNPLIDSKTVVPNDIIHNPDANMFVITGPNNGGKTTYVKTVGLLQVLGQSGLPITASSAQISLVDGVYTHFVAPDDITEGEGRYRNELRRMRTILENATPYSLTILDEPCGGTSYEEGIEQSRILLDAFHSLGVATYFTTHMHPLTVSVGDGKLPCARNLHVECAYENGEIVYKYKIVPGASGKSYGLEVAKDLNLDKAAIKSLIRIRAKKSGFNSLLRNKLS